VLLFAIRVRSWRLTSEYLQWAPYAPNMTASAPEAPANFTKGLPEKIILETCRSFRCLGISAICWGAEFPDDRVRPQIEPPCKNEV